MKYFDIYGNTINLNIRQNEKIKTKFGGLMTIISFISIITIILFEGKDFIYKNNPRVSKETHLNEEYEKLNISSNQFPIAIALVDDYEKILNITNYFDIEINYMSYIISNSQTSNETNGNYNNLQKINPSKCNYKDYRGKIEIKKFESLKLAQYFCPNITNIPLEGYWEDEKVYYLNIQIKKCNRDKHSNCLSEQEIDQFIISNKAIFYFFYLVPNFNLYNYDYPIGYRIHKDYRYLTTNLKKSYYYGFRKNDIVTDSGWIFQEEKLVNYFDFLDLGFDAIKYESDDKIMINLEITSTNSVMEINRKYVKLSNILGLIGGLTKIYSTIFLFFNKFFSRIKFLEIIINELFFIKEDLKKINLATNEIKTNPYINERRDVLKFNFEKSNSDKIILLDNASSNYSNTWNIEIQSGFPYKKNRREIINNKLVSLNKNEDKNYFSKISSNSSRRSYNLNSEISNKEKNNENNSRTRFDLILDNLRKKERKSYFNISCEDFINLYKMQFVKKTLSNKEKLKKYKILLMGQEKISQYLNLEKIIEKFENIEIIKKILFERYQRNILDIISLPILDLNNSNQQKGNKNIYKKMKNKDINFSEKIYYEKSLSSNHNLKNLKTFLGGYDKRLNNKIDEKIIKILQEC